MQTYTTCPKCSHKRKKSSDKCLSINTVTGNYNCHHCGYSGRKGGNGINMSAEHQLRKPMPKLSNEALPENVIRFFETRGISEGVLRRNKICTNGTEIMFPYLKAGEVVNVKYRTRNKKFRQETGAEKVFYGLDDIKESVEIIIVEGEIDKLSFEEAGFFNVISVPDGAPSANAKSYESKFSYIENCEKELKGVQKIILAVDSDEPGKKLEEELQRRLGPERCWRVTWSGGCKDANEVLVKYSSTRLSQLIQEAKPVPIEGIFSVNDISGDIDVLYRDGLKGGVSTKWIKVDNYYTVRPGEVTVITGIPSHGKSSWQTALMVNIAISEGWRFGVFSPENQPLQRHAAQILSLFHSKPFQEGMRERMTVDELETAKVWMNEQFTFILPPDDQLSIDAILSKAKVCVTRYGIKGLVLDPWNELDHARPAGQTETEYISDCLTKIRRFARTYRIHVWLIAHPTKLQRGKDGKYPVPSPYDISGSAHFRNKADNCLTVWRDLLDEDRDVEIHVQKVRFREVGKVGMLKIRYDIATGRYLDAS
jgi:twinkle protein